MFDWRNITKIGSLRKKHSVGGIVIVKNVCTFHDHIFFIFPQNHGQSVYAYQTFFYLHENLFKMNHVHVVKHTH